MSNLDQIIGNLQSACVKHEINYPQSYLVGFEKAWGDYAITETQGEIKLGIMGSEAQWSWFTVYDPNQNDEFIAYDQTYSQRTGKSRRAWRTGFDLIRKFSK